MERWFCRSDEEWDALAERLKLTACPHCKVVGTLIRHGYLRGFDDSSPRQKTVRARRVFCSNRNGRPGCGRTFSVWCADKIRRLSLTSGCLWRFLKHAVAGSIAHAIRTSTTSTASSCSRTGKWMPTPLFGMDADPFPGCEGAADAVDAAPCSDNNRSATLPTLQICHTLFT